jgi:protein NEDD1
MRGGTKKESTTAKATATPPIKGVKLKEHTPHTRLSASPKANAAPVVNISAPGTRSNRLTKEIKDVDTEVPRRARTVSSTSRTRKSSSKESGSVSAAARLAVPRETALQDQKGRSRTTSSASRVDSESGMSARSGSPGSRPGSSVSRPGSSISRAGASPIPPVPALPGQYQVASGGRVESGSRTPSPDLPDMDMGPMTPVATGRKRAGAGMEMGVLGLGTPEVDRWIEAGKGKGRDGMGRDGRDSKGKGKSVGFKEQKDDTDEESKEDEGADMEMERERERNMAMQISPRRPTGVGSSNSWVPSPLRQGIPASPGGSAHDLLCTIVRDVMYDFRRETKAEMTGLHLDLVRMGRGWKKELRGLMEEYVGDLRDLREENRGLREENERLRRGY